MFSVRCRTGGRIHVRAGATGAVILIVVATFSLWPTPVAAGPGPATLTVTPHRQRLQTVSPLVLRTIRVIDSADDDRADVLWAVYTAVSRQGEATLIRWALELQSVVRARKGNYLHALCWILNENRSSRARAFADALARRGIAIGPDSGHFENLEHLDPTARLPELPEHVGNTPIGAWVDCFVEVRYQLSYRPERKGQLSRLLQVTYDDGTRLDIDIRLISDNYDPAQNQSLGRMYLGTAGRLYPLRMDRLSTPNLWNAKHAALAEMRAFNRDFEAVVSFSTSATLNTLPLGLAVRVQQPQTTTVAPRGTAPASARNPGGMSTGTARASSQTVASGKPSSKPAGNAPPPPANSATTGGTSGSGRVTGRVATRINLARDRTRFTPLRNSGEKVSAGWRHVVEGHFNRPVTRNRSVFSISQQELRELLQSDVVVQSPVTAVSGGQFVRTVDVGRIIGTATLKNGGGATSVLHVITDEAGNLITTFPL